MASVSNIDDDAMRRRYEEGASILAICCEFGVHQTTVKNRLRAAGVERRKPGKRRWDVDEDKLRRLYNSGAETIQTLSVRYGVSTTTVSNRLVSMGEYKRTPLGGETKRDETEEMAVLYRAGYAQHEIGETYGISKQAVSRRLRSIGVTRADRGERTEEPNDPSTSDDADNATSRLLATKWGSTSG